MFNLQDYETVETRLAKFIADFPDFRIDTELESFQNDRFIVKAYIYRTFADSVAFSTGYAEEKVTDRGVNSTSALENCETSAIGRALANAGYATKGKRPSREEMTKVVKPSQPQPTSTAVKQVGVTDYVADGWETYTSVNGGQTSEPKELDATVLIQQELGGEILPECVHGVRNLKEGTSKTGKPYKGYVCSSRTRDDQCSPIWWILSPSGQFIPPKEVGDV